MDGGRRSFSLNLHTKKKRVEFSLQTFRIKSIDER
jgi:hypothetical protein